MKPTREFPPGKPVFATARLTLRQMTLDDLDFVAAMLAHPEVMRHYPRCYSRAEAESWICRGLDRYRRDGHSLWLVTEKATGEAVGQIGLIEQHVDGVNESEVGYLLHRPYWRRGFATEAALATRDYAFSQLGRQRVISLIRPQNQPSQEVALKLGMQVEKLTLHNGDEHLVFAVARPR